MTILKTESLAIELEDKVLFNDLNLQFLPGEVWGILGPNGSGKTTFFNVLAGLQESTQGKVSLNGKPISEFASRERAKKIGLLFQENEFFLSNRVIETVMMGRYPYAKYWLRESKEDQAIAYQALSTMSLKEFSNREVATLSGGEQRRLSIAALLAQNPEIYLLDEPANHLDFEQQIYALSLFKNLAKEQNRTIIMVLHDIHLLRIFCDHIMIVGQNQSCIVGSSEELLAHSSLKRFFSEEVLQVFER